MKSHLQRSLAAALLVLLPGSILAQVTNTAEDFFHDGAGLFIKGENPEALKSVNAGLVAYPQDFHLTELKKLLEQQQQQQQQQKDQQQKQDQQKQQSKDQQKQQPQDQQKQQDQQQADKDKDQGSKEEQAQQQKPSEEMTPEEARLMLDAVKQQEQANRDRLRVVIGQPEPTKQNW